MMLRPARLLALTTALLLSPSVALAATAPTDEAGDAQLLLLLDASRSMEDPDAQGEPKIDAARAALHDVIGGLDPSQSVGLRVFGGSVTLDRPMEEKCADSELVVPVGAGTADELSAAVDDYAPLGETPIAHALQQAGEDLGASGHRTVVLVSDGIATCDPDPCEVAEQLTADGLDLVVHTVGLGADEQTRSQLQCIAEAAGGSYYDAADGETLSSALTRISTRAFRPFTISGTPVQGTPDVADAPVLGEGQYTDTMAQDKARAKHYLVRRQLTGSVLHAGATMRPERGGLSAYDVVLATRDGDTCGMSVAMPWSGGAGNSFGSTGTSSARFGGYDVDDECTTAPELVLSVYPQSGSEQIVDQAYEILIIEEPPVANLGDLPVSSPLPEWQDLVPGDPQQDVVAGSSLNDAPLIEPGRTYSSELTRGEIVFFRVPVEHGQHLQALLEVAEPTGLLAQSTGPVSDIADVDIIGPNRANARSVLADTGDLKARAILQPDSAVQAGALTPEVRWANHESGNEEGAALAGDYVVSVSLTSDRDQLLPVPFTLTTQLVGDVSGVPEYASAEDTADEGEAQETVADSTDGTTAPVREDAAPEAAVERPDDAEADGRPAWLAWALAAVGVVLAGSGAALLGRRRA